jgi:predicted phage terminase large subunit-like protein
MTRWSTKDLTAKLVNSQADENADKWDIIEFPAILPNGKPVWPEYWKIEDFEAVKASAGVNKFNAQYQQNPTSEEGAIIKREWWNDWDKEDLPLVTHCIQSYDTAFLKKETADYSAITTWGVFRESEDSQECLILLDAWKGRVEFPELRRVAKEQYDYWKPETVIVEAKASGLPLTHELRNMDIPVVNFTPSKGQDKHARINAVAPLFESGKIYAPLDREYAEEVVEECAAFPYGENDDLVDSVTQALLRYRQGGLITHPEDYKEEPLPRSKKSYYW